jgi:hypothetical protein
MTSNIGKLAKHPARVGELIHVCTVSRDGEHAELTNVEAGRVAKSNTRRLIVALADEENPGETFSLEARPDGICWDDSDETVYVARPTRQSRALLKRLTLVRSARCVDWAEVPSELIERTLAQITEQAPQALEI